MRITKPTRFPERRGVRLTKAAGWIAIAFGAVHVITAPLESRPRDIWSQVVDEGWWNTFTLDKATTLAELERSETFWSHWAASAFRCWCSVCTSSGRPANANACRGGSAGPSWLGRCPS